MGGPQRRRALFWHRWAQYGTGGRSTRFFYPLKKFLRCAARTARHALGSCCHLPLTRALLCRSLSARPAAPHRPLPAATASVQGSPHREWAFHLHQLGGGHWAAVARAPLAEVVDAWGVSGKRVS